MKKLALIVLTLCTLSGIAQTEKHSQEQKKDRHHLRKSMSAEDIANLKSKKLTLKLDLSDAQQKKVYDALLKSTKANEGLRKKHFQNKDNGEKPSPEKVIEAKNLRLDRQIELKRKLKTILTPEQYEKFEKMKHHKVKKHKKRRSKRKMD